jgi:hypothetical protein
VWGDAARQKGEEGAREEERNKQKIERRVKGKGKTNKYWKERRDMAKYRKRNNCLTNSSSTK